MALRQLPPAGKVDGYCTFCGRDVFVAEDTLECPTCGQSINPLSLPRVPDRVGEAARAIAAVERGEVTPKTPALIAAPVAAQRSPEPVSTAPEPILLPAIDQAIAWYADTARLRDQLLDDEITLAERLKRTRATRKRLDQVIGLFTVEETTPAPIVVDVPEPEPVEPVPVAAEPAPVVEAVTEPDPEPETVAITTPAVTEPVRDWCGVALTAPDAEAPSVTKRWSQDHDQCINPACASTERQHAAGGRCTRCHSYWNSRGIERPADLFPTASLTRSETPS